MLVEDVLFLLERDLYLLELVLHDFCGEVQPGQFEVVEVGCDFFASELEELLVEPAAELDEPVEVHYALQHYVVESELRELLSALAAGVVEGSDHPVHFGVEYDLLEEVNSLHRSQLLLLHNQVLHHLLAFLSIGNFAYLLDLSLDAHFVDDLVIDVLQE